VSLKKIADVLNKEDYTTKEDKIFQSMRDKRIFDSNCTESNLYLSYIINLD